METGKVQELELTHTKYYTVQWNGKTIHKVLASYEGYGTEKSFESKEKALAWLERVAPTRREYIPTLDEITCNGKYTCD